METAQPTSEKIVEYVNGLYEIFKVEDSCRAAVNVRIHEIGTPLSLANMRGELPVKCIYTSEALSKTMFDFSMNYYIANIDVEYNRSMETKFPDSYIVFNLGLIESPDHGTNITVGVIESFNKILELNKCGQLEEDEQLGS